jgi:hypothetical protein
MLKVRVSNKRVLVQIKPLMEVSFASFYSFTGGPTVTNRTQPQQHSATNRPERTTPSTLSSRRVGEPFATPPA